MAEPRSLVLDVDTAEDLDALRVALAARTGGAAHTRGLLARLDRQSSSRAGVGARRRACPRCARATTSPRCSPRRRRPTSPATCSCIAHKVVSKAEGALRGARRDVDGRPSARAPWPREHDKDPRHVQVVLDESAEPCCARERGVLICRTHHGFVCANAGVDTSNAPDDGALVLLPRDPDASAARAARRRCRAAPAVVIADSFGRAWRHGQCDVAIGIAGLAPLDDWRGRARRARARAARDVDRRRRRGGRRGRPGARQGLARAGGRSSAGSTRHVTDDDGPGAAALVRPLDEDLFR